MTLVPSAKHRFHEVEGTFNLRETGGYGATGGTTRWGKLFRSDALHALTNVSRTHLNELGIAHIVDLRAESELFNAPSRLEGLTVTVAHTPIYGATPAFDEIEGITLASLYRMIIAEYGDNLARAVTEIARSGSNPVLVHCTAGKDRTGLVIGLALLAVGVDRRDVIADYSTTEQNLARGWSAAMLARMVAEGVVATPTLEHIVSASPPELLAEIIGHIDADFGSAAEYLLAHGFDPSDLDLLHASLVEATPAESTETEESRS